MSSVQVHPDTISMDFHMQVLKDNWDESFSKYGEMLELIRIEYFGKPSKNALNMDLQRETPISVKPRYIAGFTRPHRYLNSASPTFGYVDAPSAPSPR
jgi:hypothetical protein